MEDPKFVLGTAGHIDHGKSALVRALTGTDPDRLSEEKQRGITIELGFARLELPSGRSMSVVDVPGHEKFIRQMVAGASGIDVVLFVVAADDGIMPQTREHLSIIELLGIKHGIVAITKSDLVDAEWLELVQGEIEGLLEDTSLEGAPIVPVSSVTGEGLPELLAAIDDVADDTDSRAQEMPMRLPIDRVFTITGAGTVVTGTMWSGTATRDATVELYPSEKTGRIRSVQVHGETVDVAHAGQRVAMNIAGIDKEDIARGDVIAAQGSLAITDRFDAFFTYLGKPGDVHEFRSGTRVHVHHGTQEVLGRVLLMDGQESLAPGESSLVQVRLEESLAPRYEDNFIVRSYSPVYTIGGGSVLDVMPARRTNLRPEERALLEALQVHNIPSAAVGLLASRSLPATSAQVAAILGVPRAQVADELNRANLARLKISGQTAYVAPDVLEFYMDAIEREIVAFHEANPTASSLAVPALLDRIDRRITLDTFNALLLEAARRNLVKIEGGAVSHPRAAVSALAEEERARDEVLALLTQQNLAPDLVPQLAEKTGFEVSLVRKVLSQLVVDEQIVRLSADLHFTVHAISQARFVVEDTIRSLGPSTAAQLRDSLGISRKYAIPLLEFFDHIAFTQREGDLRTLRDNEL